MSYKCAILGHKFGDAEVERDRQEDGNEVVITERKVETCARCGESQTVSENKEVTTLETAADIVSDDLGSSEAAPTPQQGDDESSPTATEPSDEISVPDAEPATPSEAVDPDEDDGVILEDNDEEAAEEDDNDDREPGEWPDESIEDASQSQKEVSWPERDDDEAEENEWEMSGDIDPQPGENTVRGPESDTLTIPEGTFVCPDCEFSTPVESSSLREGDFCPECHMATLDHQTD